MTSTRRTPDLSSLLRLRDAAEQLAISPKTLRRAIWRGELGCYRPGPGPTSPILLAPREIERWLRERCGARQLAPAVGA